MSLQWALVAAFLYAEIAFIIILLLPIISPKIWQKFFKSRFLKSIENQANLYFSGFLIILGLLFLDSIREMRKYSESREEDQHSHGHLDAETMHSMKLFRAQRNFYIAGFALFLCLVIRRLVILIKNQAQLMAECEAALNQARSASDAAQSMLSERSAPVTASGDSTASENAGNQRKEKQEEELRKMRQDLAEAKEELMRCQVNCDSMKKQAESVSTEYDRLLKEHSNLQREVESLKSDDSRKDR
jgi:B-cell receptor-associated protein 31